jgi:hypothetical protein
MVGNICRNSCLSASAAIFCSSVRHHDTFADTEVCKSFTSFISLFRVTSLLQFFCPVSCSVCAARPLLKGVYNFMLDAGVK